MLKAILAHEIVQQVLGRALDLALRLIAASIRWHITGQMNLAAAAQSGAPVILCLWHGRLAMAPQIWAKAGPLRGLSAAFVVSRSRDGNIGARIATRLNIALIRGSGSKPGNGKRNKSDKGGMDALIGMVEHLSGKAILGLTPDGPRGPARQVGPALVLLAERTGAVIVPVAWSARRARQLRSWDGFLLPWPFTRGAICFGAPIAPVRGERSTRAARGLGIAAALDGVTRAADEFCDRRA